MSEQWSPNTWAPVTLKARIEHAPGLATFVLEGHRCAFAPGQFVQLGLEIDGEPVGRPYSLSSAPGADLETLIVRVDDGQLTPRLFELSPGDPLYVHRVASGAFGLRRVQDAPTLWMIATGTGLSPFLSMLRAGGLERFGKVVLVHGVRQGAHLVAREEIQALGAQHIAVVSREAVPGALSGRITEQIASGELERIAGAPLDPSAQVLLCGNPAMIAETYGLLTDRGLTRNRPRKPGNITFEAYW